MSNVSSVIHLLAKANEGFVTTAGGTISAGATTVSLTTVTGLTNSSTFVGVIEPGTANEQVFTGIVDTGGSQVTGVVWTKGTNVSHAAGVTIVDYVTSTFLNMLTRWAAIQHNDDGTHSTVTATAITSGTLTVTGSAAVTGNHTVSGNVIVTGTVRSTPRITVAASAATLTPNIDTFGIYDLTAQTVALTIANPTGTPRNGDGLIFRIKDDGTSRAISYGTAYQNTSGLDTLVATTAGKWHTIGCMYNSTTSTWQISSFATEA